MKKTKSTKRITFISDADVFRQFSVKCATLGSKWSERLRELIKRDLEG